jgi:hypothetical protein
LQLEGDESHDASAVNLAWLAIPTLTYEVLTARINALTLVKQISRQQKKAPARGMPGLRFERGTSSRWGGKSSRNYVSITRLDHPELLTPAVGLSGCERYATHADQHGACRDHVAWSSRQPLEVVENPRQHVASLSVGCDMKILAK